MPSMKCDGWLLTDVRAVRPGVAGRLIPVGRARRSQARRRSPASLSDAAERAQRHHVDRDTVRRRDTRLSHVTDRPQGARSRDRRRQSAVVVPDVYTYRSCPVSERFWKAIASSD